LANSANLARVIEAVNEISHGAYVQFGPDWMSCNTMDISGVVMVSTRMKIAAEGLTDPIMIQMDFDMLNGMVFAPGMTEMLVTEGQVKFIAGKAVYKVRNIVDPQIKGSTPPILSWPVELKIKASELSYGLGAVYGVLDKKDASAALAFQFDKGEFVIGDRSWEKVNVTFGGNDFVLLKMTEGKFQTILSADYVKLVEKHVRSFGEVVVKMGNNYPMAMGNGDESLGIGFLISPRIVNE